MDQHYLSYISENKLIYEAKTNSGEVVSILKNRSPSTELPMSSNSEVFRTPYHYLVIAAAGLPLGGFISCFFSATVIIDCYLISQRMRLTEKEKVRIKNFTICSVILFLLGLPLSFLFVMHLIY